jgi:hypothetical protein
MYRVYNYADAEDCPFAALLAKAPANNIRGSPYSASRQAADMLSLSGCPQTAAIQLSS